MKRKTLSILLCAAMAVSMLAGCGGSSDSQSSSQGSDETQTQESGAADTIVYSMDTAPSGVFNPLISDTAYDEAVNSAVYASLLTVNPDSELEEYLCESYEVSDDQLVITYHLRDNAKWHDGEDVTADDVVFTFTSMADGSYTGGNYGDVEKIKGAKAYHDGQADSVEGLKAVDEKTVEVTFEEIYAPAVTNLGVMGIIPKHIWEGADIAEWDNQTDLLNAPVGCGPYKLTEFKNGEYVSFEAAEDFFLGAPKTAKLMYKVVNPDTIQAEFKNGEINIANVSDLQSADIEAMEGEGLKLVSYPNFMFQYMGINLREEIFQDVNVRQAFMYAIDRKAMVEQLLEGRGEIVNAPMLPMLWSYPDESELEQYDYNPDKATDLLAAAGWTDSDGDGIVENEAGEKFSVVIDCPTGSAKREQAAVIIQESLKQVGVDVEINSMEFSALMEKVVSNHDFDLYMMGNTLDLDPDPKPYWHSDAISNEPGVQGYNIVGYNNPETDALIEQGLATLVEDERAQVYHEFGKILNNDIGQVYLYNQDIERMYSEGLEGYQPSTFNEFYNLHNWELK